jgi:hypothetical protein
MTNLRLFLAKKMVGGEKLVLKHSKLQKTHLDPLWLELPGLVTVFCWLMAMTTRFPDDVIESVDLSKPSDKSCGDPLATGVDSASFVGDSGFDLLPLLVLDLWNESINDHSGVSGELEPI